MQTNRLDFTSELEGLQSRFEESLEALAFLYDEMQRESFCPKDWEAIQFCRRLPGHLAVMNVIQRDLSSSTSKLEQLIKTAYSRMEGIT